MHTFQNHWTERAGWSADWNALPDPPHLVLVFGATAVLENGVLGDVRRACPDAFLFGGSTAGEVVDTELHQSSLIATAVRFEDTRIDVRSARVAAPGRSREAGRLLVSQFEPTGLGHLFVLADGADVNGSDLVRGMKDVLPSGVTVTGGLAGNGTRFADTLVLAGGEPARGMVSAIAFYGDRIRVGFGCRGGWDPFGPERLVTGSEGAVLHELDGRSALDLYRLYLGQHAAGLPSTGLLYPLSVREPGASGVEVVRTLLAVDETDGSIRFAGDVPRGSYARLMKANFNRLIDGAADAARACTRRVPGAADLAVVISCVGRRMVLKQRAEEELEAVRDVLGERPAMAGFYSYGEIAPAPSGPGPEFHNQTMTVTTFAER